MLAEASRRRSRNVALVFLGAVGVVGGVVAWEAWQRSRVAGDTPQPAPSPALPPRPLSVDHTYANNEYLPGAGYYHAPNHGWFPFPYNYHDPSRGYFAGGLWQAAPFLLNALSSQPSNAAVVAARGLRDAQQRPAPAPARGSGFSSFRGSGLTGTSGFSASRPATSAPTPSRAAPSISRGGFGSSAHGASGAS